MSDAIYATFCESCEKLVSVKHGCPHREPYDIEAVRRLENKLASMIKYLCEVRSGARTTDTAAFEHLLDDSQVQDWLDKMDKAGRIERTRFITG